MKDPLKQFVTLRDSLLKERERLDSRLGDIHAALGFGSEIGSAVAYEPRAGREKRSGLTLKEAILKATAKRPLTRGEILEAVIGLGYRFSTKDPNNSIGVIIYGKNPRFKNEAGRFSVRKQNGRLRASA